MHDSEIQKAATDSGEGVEEAGGERSGEFGAEDSAGMSFFLCRLLFSHPSSFPLFLTPSSSLTHPTPSLPLSQSPPPPPPSSSIIHHPSPLTSPHNPHPSLTPSSGTPIHRPPLRLTPPLRDFRVRNATSSAQGAGRAHERDAEGEEEGD